MTVQYFPNGNLMYNAIYYFQVELLPQSLVVLTQSMINYNRNLQLHENPIQVGLTKIRVSV